MCREWDSPLLADRALPDTLNSRDTAAAKYICHNPVLRRTPGSRNKSGPVFKISIFLRMNPLAEMIRCQLPAQLQQFPTDLALCT
jgi:hypothetical protein